MVVDYDRAALEIEETENGDDKGTFTALNGFVSLFSLLLYIKGETLPA